MERLEQLIDDMATDVATHLNVDKKAVLKIMKQGPAKKEVKPAAKKTVEAKKAPVKPNGNKAESDSEEEVPKKAVTKPVPKAPAKATVKAPAKKPVPVEESDDSEVEVVKKTSGSHSGTSGSHSGTSAKKSAKKESDAEEVAHAIHTVAYKGHQIYKYKGHRIVFTTDSTIKGELNKEDKIVPITDQELIDYFNDLGVYAEPNGVKQTKKVPPKKKPVEESSDEEEEEEEQQLAEE